MSEAKGPERTKRFVEVLRHWQAIERDAIDKTSEIMEKTDNKLIRQIMEIIRNDSVQHHRVQQFLIDSVTKEAISLTPDDLAAIWDAIEEHDALEKETIEMAKKLQADTHNIVHKALLDYLLVDEQKHDTILDQLENFKKGIYPYA